MNEQEKIEVLEEIFFQTQPEFGQRIIKKGVGRIDLETTHDGGRSWRVTLHDYFTGTIIE